MSIWIIGGTSGIGEAVANIVEDLDPHTIVTGEDCDVTDFALVRDRLFDIAENANSKNPLNRFVYSAGVNYLNWLGKYDCAGIVNVQELFDVNVVGFINLLDAIVEAQEEGLVPRKISIVAISSDAADRPLRTSIGYCASKAALNMAVRCAARELGESGATINAISPGMTEGTQMTAYVDKRVQELRGWTEEKMLEYENSQAVVKRRATPEEIALVVSDVLFGPDYLNGAIIPVNGGR